MVAPPLLGCRVLLTRPLEQADEWRSALEAAGAVVISYPTIEVRPPRSWAPLDEALAKLDRYDWLVFTSAGAVRATSGRLPPEVVPAQLVRPAIAAVGGQTARALEEHGFRVALVPREERQEGLIAALAGLGRGSSVLFPQAVGGRQDLAVALRGAGCTVDVVPASETASRRDLPPPPPFDVATFASPSALAALVDAHGTKALAARPLVVIGATTAAAAQARGLRPLVASAARASAVIEAIVASLEEEKGAR
jgi:uroporphyrinogen III methyltransferase/synthase